MAKADILKPFILSFEGGFVNDPNDLGGATNKGVTLGVFRTTGYDNDGDGDCDVYDLKKITDTQWLAIFKNKYWNRWQADKIKNQAVANMLVDWLWCSGKYGITYPQQILKVKADGIVGEKTIAAINNANPEILFSLLKASRMSYLNMIAEKRPQNKKYLRGWRRRVEAMNYNSLTTNNNKRITW